MQKHYNYLTIDLDRKIYNTLNAIQGDSKSRYILVNLISNSLPYDLTGTSVKVYGVKKDKTIFFNAATIIDAKQGQFEIELTSQALAVTGYLELQILISGSNQEKLTTFSFFINVGKTIVNDAAIESANEFTALTKALSSVQNIDNRFNEVNEQFNTKANLSDLNLDDGSKDLQLLINEKISNNKNLRLNPNINYTINTTLSINGKIEIDGQGCTVNVNLSDFAMNVISTEDVTIKNMTFKGVKIGAKGIKVNSIYTQLLNIKFEDIEEFIFLEHGVYELIAKDIYATGSRLLNTGIICNGTDSHFTDIIMKNYNNPIVMDGTGNVLTRIHPWMLGGIDNSNGICIKAKSGSNRYNNCCWDGYRTVLEASTGWSGSIFNNCLIFYSEHTWDNSVQYGAQLLVNNGVTDVLPQVLFSNSEFFAPPKGLTIDYTNWQINYGESNMYKENVTGRLEQSFNIIFDGNFTDIGSSIKIQSVSKIEIQCKYIDSNIASGWGTIAYLGLLPENDVYTNGIIVYEDETSQMIPIKISKADYKILGFFPQSKNKNVKLYLNYVF